MNDHTETFRENNRDLLNREDDADVKRTTEFEPSRVAYDSTERRLQNLVKEAEVKLTAREATTALERSKAREVAKEALKEHYSDDFDLDDPPESLDRFETMITLRRLERAVVENGKAESEWPEDVDLGGLPDVELAVEMVRTMQSYGELAEPHLARLGGATVCDAEVRKEATAALKELRDENRTSHDSLREALAAWIRPGGGN